MKHPKAQIAVRLTALLVLTLPAIPFAEAQTPPQESRRPLMQDDMMPGMMTCPGIMGGGMRGGGMMGGGGMDGMMMQGRGPMGTGNCPMMGGDASAHVAGRIAFLKAELAISDQQKEAWDTYAVALKKALEGTETCTPP